MVRPAGFEDQGPATRTSENRKPRWEKAVEELKSLNTGMDEAHARLQGSMEAFRRQMRESHEKLVALICERFGVQPIEDKEVKKEEPLRVVERTTTDAEHMNESEYGGESRESLTKVREQPTEELRLHEHVPESVSGHNTVDSEYGVGSEFRAPLKRLTTSTLVGEEQCHPLSGKSPWEIDVRSREAKSTTAGFRCGHRVTSKNMGPRRSRVRRPKMAFAASVKKKRQVREPGKTKHKKVKTVSMAPTKSRCRQPYATSRKAEKKRRRSSKPWKKKSRSKQGGANGVSGNRLRCSFRPNQNKVGETTIETRRRWGRSQLRRPNSGKKKTKHKRLWKERMKRMKLGFIDQPTKTSRHISPRGLDFISVNRLSSSWRPRIKSAGGATNGPRLDAFIVQQPSKFQPSKKLMDSLFTPSLSFISDPSPSFIVLIYHYHRQTQTYPDAHSLLYLSRSQLTSHPCNPQKTILFFLLPLVVQHLSQPSFGPQSSKWAYKARPPWVNRVRSLELKRVSSGPMSSKMRLPKGDPFLVSKELMHASLEDNTYYRERAMVGRAGANAGSGYAGSNDNLRNSSESKIPSFIAGCIGEVKKLLGSVQHNSFIPNMGQGIHGTRSHRLGQNLAKLREIKWGKEKGAKAMNELNCDGNLLLCDEWPRSLHKECASKSATGIKDYRNLKASAIALFQLQYWVSLTVGVSLIIQQQFKGVNGIVFYANSIFISAGVLQSIGSITIVIIHVLMTILG